MSFNIMQLLGMIFEGTGLILGFLAAYLVLKKDKNYIGNKLMAVSTILFGIYMGSILTYDILYPILPAPFNNWSVEIFNRAGLIAILGGSMFLYFTIKVMCHSSAWLNDKKHTYPYLIATLAYGIYISMIDYIEVIEGETVNTQIDLIPLLILIVGVLFFIVSALSGLYKYGIKKGQGEMKKKMSIFFVGLMIGLSAIFVNIASNVLDDVSGFLDIIFFGTLALAMVVMTFGFTGKRDE